MKKGYYSYDEYQKSVVPWIDEAPKKWDFVRNKNVMKLKKEIVGDNHQYFTLLSLTLKGIIARDLENPKGKFPKDFSTYQIVNENDLVFCLFDIDETPRTVGLSSLKGMITGAYTVFEVAEGVSPKYLYYYYLFLDQHKSLKPLYTGLRKVINSDVFLRTKMPLPSYQEQIQIVKYLDYKLIKKDEFVTGKKRLISALKEQKQAIINGVVTKGLSNNISKKLSGVEGLEDIPKHWEVKPLKHYVKSNTETISESYGLENIIDYIDISTVGFGELKKSPVKYKFGDAPSRARRIVHYGDTIISTVRTYLKSICFIDENIQNCIVSTGFAVLTPNKKVYPKLLNYVLSSYYFLNSVSKNSIGVSYPAIGEVELMSLKIALPPNINEQKEMLEYIDEKTREIDRSISILEQEIELMKEYGNRLIGDVVTGKVCVQDIEVPKLYESDLKFEKTIESDGNFETEEVEIL